MSKHKYKQKHCCTIWCCSLITFTRRDVEMKPRGIHAAFSRSTFVCVLFHTRTSFICVIFVSPLCSLVIALIQFFPSYPPHVFVKWLDKRHLPFYISICIFPLSLFPPIPPLTHEPTHTLSLSFDLHPRMFYSSYITMYYYDEWRAHLRPSSHASDIDMVVPRLEEQDYILTSNLFSSILCILVVDIGI